MFIYQEADFATHVGGTSRRVFCTEYPPWNKCKNNWNAGPVQVGLEIGPTFWLHTYSASE